MYLRAQDFHHHISRRNSIKSFLDNFVTHFSLGNTPNSPAEGNERNHSSSIRGFYFFENGDLSCFKCTPDFYINTEIIQLAFDHIISHVNNIFEQNHSNNDSECDGQSQRNAFERLLGKILMKEPREASKLNDLPPFIAGYTVPLEQKKSEKEFMWNPQIYVDGFEQLHIAVYEVTESHALAILTEEPHFDKSYSTMQQVPPMFQEIAHMANDAVKDIFKPEHMEMDYEKYSKLDCNAIYVDPEGHRHTEKSAVTIISRWGSLAEFIENFPSEALSVMMDSFFGDSRTLDSLSGDSVQEGREFCLKLSRSWVFGQKNDMGQEFYVILERSKHESLSDVTKAVAFIQSEFYTFLSAQALLNKEPTQ